MSDEKVYRAVSVAGGEESNMTLTQARNQVEAWESKGYSSYVEHMHDPEWEDLPYGEATVLAPITPYQVVQSLGADREALKGFMFNMFELLDWSYAETPSGYTIYTNEEV